MRLERKSLIAVTLLLMTGCSANRQARQSDTVYNSPEPVPMPMRHADEYDSGAGQYEYNHEATPPRNESLNPPSRPFPPSVPMGEPAQAPPAIGVSRVKSVSWLRSTSNRHAQESCSDPAWGDGCSTGQYSQLSPDFFAEGCVTSEPALAAPRRRCREKTTLLESIRGWNLRSRTRRAERIQRSQSCGGPTTCSPGCFAPDDCRTFIHNGGSYYESQPSIQQSLGGETHGNLAEPLRENGWDNQTATPDPRFTPDELMELPSTLIEAPANGPGRANVPIAPMIEPMPVLPTPESAPGQSSPAGQNLNVPSPVPQQGSPDSVKHLVRPPQWPRSIPPVAAPVNIPVASPGIPVDPSLPMIQPGRRI